MDTREAHNAGVSEGGWCGCYQCWIAAKTDKEIEMKQNEVEIQVTQNFILDQKKAEYYALYSFVLDSLHGGEAEFDQFIKTQKAHPDWTPIEISRSQISKIFPDKQFCCS